MDNSALLRYFRDVRKYKILPHDDLYDTFVQYHRGDQSLEEVLVKSLMLYATELAIDFAFKNHYRPDDCVSVALEGLVEGVRKFNPSRSTIPLACIRYYVRGYLHQYRRDFEPWWNFGLVQRLRSINEEFDDLSFSYQHALSCMQRNNHVSLDEPVTDEPDVTLADILESFSSESITEDVKSLLSVLDILKPRDRNRIRAFYGIDCIPMSIEMIADVEGTTNQAISASLRRSKDQLTKYALSHPDYLREVKDVLSC